MAGRKIIRNYISLSSGQIFSQLLTFLALVYLARVIGPESLGKIGFAQVYTSYFMFFTDIGLNLLGVRSIARDRASANELMNEILSIRLVLATLLFFVLAALDFLLFKETDLRILILIYGLTIFSFAGALDFLFLGTGRSGLIGIVNSIRAVVFLVLVLIFVHNADELYRVAVFFLASYLVSALCYVALGRVVVGYKLKLGFDPGRWRQLVIAALPLGAITLLSVFTQQQSVLLLGFFSQPAEVGLYYGMFKIIFMALFAISLFGDTIYPLLARREDNVFLASLKLAAIVLLPAMFLFNSFDVEIISLALGKEFIAGAHIFRILVWVIPLTALLTVFNKTLIAGKHDRKCLTANTAGFAISVLSGIYLVSAFGMVGAAVSYVFSLVIANLFMGYYVFRVRHKVAIEPAA